MRTKSILISLALGVSVVGGGFQAAQASLSQCTSTDTCIWGNNDFKWYLGSRNDGLGVGTLSGEANNEMDSWANRSSGSSAGYDDPTPDGDDDGCQTWSAVSNDNNVSPFNSDEVSSWRTNRGC